MPRPDAITELWNWISDGPGDDVRPHAECEAARRLIERGERKPTKAPTKPRTNPTVTERMQNPKYRLWRAFVDESSPYLASGS